MLEEIKPELILISDYDKWIITHESVETVKNYANENNIKILVDIKPKNLELFYDVYLVKPNFKEFCEMMGTQWIENTEENIAKYGKAFVQKYRTNIVITRGWKWSSLITKQWDVYHIPSEELKVFDVSWAWDTYIATLTYAISNNYSLVDAVKLSNKASWVVVWKVWTAAITREELWI
jgi:D-beta-D-heptose 7-phosphate kinase/D-beta-D-heptose 1-phosphate adenosyltransferase